MFLGVARRLELSPCNTKQERRDKSQTLQLHAQRGGTSQWSSRVEEERDETSRGSNNRGMMCTDASAPLTAALPIHCIFRHVPIVVDALCIDLRLLWDRASPS